MLMLVGRREFIAQAEVDGQVRPDLPGVVGVVILARGPELRHGQPQRPGTVTGQTQNVVGHAVARVRRSGRALGGLPRETERTARKLVADLVVAVAPDLRPEPERVPAAADGNVVDPLEDVRAGEIRRRAGFAEAREAGDADGGDAPNNRLRDGNARNSPQLANHVPLISTGLEVGVAEAVVAETKFVNDGRRQHARVGEHGLLDLRIQLESLPRESAGSELEFIAIAPPAEPGGSRGLGKVDAGGELIGVLAPDLGRFVVARQPRRRDIRQRIELQQLLGLPIEPAGGNDVSRKRARHDLAAAAHPGARIVEYLRDPGKIAAPHLRIREVGDAAQSLAVTQGLIIRQEEQPVFPVEEFRDPDRPAEREPVLVANKGILDRPRGGEREIIGVHVVVPEELK